MVSQHHLFFVCLLSFALEGCIPVPVHEKEPYSQDVLNLKVGLTTKNDVIKRFGEPGATYAQESEFVYTDFQVEVGFLIPSPNASNPAIGIQHFLLLSFDENDVLSDLHVESSAASRGCIPAGWCFDSRNRVWRLASAEQDSSAKQFLVPGDQCGVYVYDVAGGDYAVSIDGDDMGSVFGKRYYQHWNVDPGSHDIALLIQPGAKTWGMKNFPTLSLNCVAGELYFVHLKPRMWSVIFEQVDPSEGRKQIAKRQLILSGPMRKIPNS